MKEMLDGNLICIANKKNAIFVMFQSRKIQVENNDH